jgi:hypothetical protein
MLGHFAYILNRMKTSVDISRWPKAALIANWSALLGYNPTTLYRHYRTGKA